MCVCDHINCSAGLSAADVKDVKNCYFYSVICQLAIVISTWGKTFACAASDFLKMTHQLDIELFSFFLFACEALWQKITSDYVEVLYFLIFNLVNKGKTHR